MTCLSGPNLITWVLKIRDSPTVVRERDVVVEDDQGDATFLAEERGGSYEPRDVGIP